MILVRAANLNPERRYAFSTVLGDFLGVSFDLAESGAHDGVVEIGDGVGRTLRVRDDFFARCDVGRGAPSTLPALPLARADVSSLINELRFAHVRVLYGAPLRNGGWILEGDGSLELGIDVFGTAFYGLSRYEETVVSGADEHDRFPATASISVAAGLAGTAWVDEAVAILAAALNRLWPGLARFRRGSVQISHDVDWPLWCDGKNAGDLARSVAADVARRRDPALAVRRVLAMMERRRGRFDGDPWNTFDFLIDAHRAHGTRGTFFFICDRRAGTIDGTYELDDSWITGLLRKLSGAGHELGVHGSYTTYRDGAQLEVELHKFRRATDKLGIAAAAVPLRQHYLRFRVPTTWRAAADAGFSYDTTVGFADVPGFRCGTSRDFAVFDIERRAELALRERPLIAMDVTFSGYQRLTARATLDALASLRNEARSLGGGFTLLWHNSSLASRAEKALYRDALSIVLA